MLQLNQGWRAALLAFLLFSGYLPGALAQQRLYANQVLSQSHAANSTAAVDGNTSTQATLTPPTLAGVASLLMGLPSKAEAGKPAGMVLNTGGLLTAAVLGGVAINTYLAPFTVPQQHLSQADILGLGVLSGSQTLVEFTAAKPFDQIEIVVGGLLNGRSVGVVQAYGTVSPLPVQLVSFQGTARPASVALSWATASELNSRYFEVQRSADGETFAALGRVAAAGSSATARHYQFADAAPLALGYYRLRQVDADGTATFSPVVTVRAELSAPLQVFPTVATSTLTVASPVATRVYLFNQRGQLLRQASIEAGQQQLDVHELPAGLYILRDASTGQPIRLEKVQ